MHRRLRPLSLALPGLIALALGAPRSVLAQDAGLTLVGTVNTETGGPASHAAIVSGVRGTLADSLGRFELRGLPGGRLQVTVRLIGFASLDTTIELHAGEPARLDVVLRLPAWATSLRAADSAAAAENIARGRVDSSVLGLFRLSGADSAPPLTFGVFGARLLAAVDRDRAPDSNTVLSPASAGLALALALSGARGATAAALARVLDTAALDRATVERRGAALLASVRGRTDVQLEIASAIWVDSAARLAPDYAAAAAAWQATVGILPLASPEALAPINGWAARVTHGRIRAFSGTPCPTRRRCSSPTPCTSRGSGSIRSSRALRARAPSPWPPAAGSASR